MIKSVLIDFFKNLGRRQHVGVEGLELNSEKKRVQMQAIRKTFEIKRSAT